MSGVALTGSGRHEVADQEVDIDNPKVVVLALSGSANESLLTLKPLLQESRRRGYDGAVALLSGSGHDRFRLLETALAAGVMGFVSPGSTVEELVQAIDVVAAGGTFVAPTLIEPADSRATNRENAHVTSMKQSLRRLTGREWEVLDLMTAGASNKQIADLLFISVRTAKYHVSNILAKLGVRSRSQAVARVLHAATGP